MEDKGYVNFWVKRRTIKGTLCEQDAYSDGIAIESREKEECVDGVEFLVGFSVYTENDDHRYYPVSYDENGGNNAHEVIEKIKSDYPAGDFENWDW